MSPLSNYVVVLTSFGFFMRLVGGARGRGRGRGGGALAALRAERRAQRNSGRRQRVVGRQPLLPPREAAAGDSPSRNAAAQAAARAPYFEPAATLEAFFLDSGREEAGFLPAEVGGRICASEATAEFRSIQSRTPPSLAPALRGGVSLGRSLVGLRPFGRPAGAFGRPPGRLQVATLLARAPLGPKGAGLVPPPFRAAPAPKSGPAGAVRAVASKSLWERQTPARGSEISKRNWRPPRLRISRGREEPNPAAPQKRTPRRLDKSQRPALRGLDVALF